MKNIVVIGGGAAGMMAAIAAAKNGAAVTLVEKNEKLGKKIYITGKGRCNLTNNCEPEVFFENVVTNPKFLYSAYYTYDQSMVMQLIEENGCTLKTERGNRVFPVSDHASDVIKALTNELKILNVNIRLNTIVTAIEQGKVYTNKGVIEADDIIVTTGGLSYPTTGSNGDGYKFAEDLGHKIVRPKAALVPVETVETDAFLMQGLSLKNVELRLFSSNKEIYSGFGEMLFTHFGLSGPLVLSASSHLAKCTDINDAFVLIDLKPALSEKELDDRLLKDFGENLNKQFKNALDKLLPKAMIPVIIERSLISGSKKINEITKEERHNLVKLIKNLKYNIKKTRGMNEAIITHGGISVKDINPSTMESKIVPHLYFAGEVIDVDALTGGFNLQIAWSTGYLAGMSAAIKE